MVDLSSLMKLTQNAEVKNVFNSLLSQFKSGGGQGQQGGQQISGLLDNLHQSGLGDQVQSWVGTGKNLPITPDQVTQAVGADTIARAAQDAGISTEQASSHLAKVLPQVVDSASPSGNAPSSKDFDQVLNAAFSGGGSRPGSATRSTPDIGDIDTRQY